MLVSGVRWIIRVITLGEPARGDVERMIACGLPVLAGIEPGGLDRTPATFTHALSQMGGGGLAEGDLTTPCCGWGLTLRTPAAPTASSCDRPGAEELVALSAMVG
mmetsp:Transcript_99756/g.173135  ORF Transcript_99756/g.173135 Transcript_99756/m.173135 type:complete len:105 (-) Transcript_99756:69-383(-)